MDTALRIQGRWISPGDLLLIRGLIAGHPGWHRTRLSRELCALWDWRDPAGRLKDMACRSLLLKLERRGLLRLPPPRRAGVNHLRAKSFQPARLDTSPLVASLADISPVSLQPAEAGGHAHIWRSLLHAHHYLGLSTKVGRNLPYLALDRGGRPVGALLFGAAAWSCAARDRHIGWDRPAREANLHRLAGNARFLIPPWVRVEHLASHLLGRAARALRVDWPAKYGYGLLMLETFVEAGRFAGTCYRAANWRPVGRTTGRTRNDPDGIIEAPVKEVLVLPLRRDCRRLLRGAGPGAGR